MTHPEGDKLGASGLHDNQETIIYEECGVRQVLRTQ